MKYSVITPLFNRSDCISRCIESVARNLAHYEHIEHIIVDDGSTDNSAQIVKSYAQRMRHINFIQLSKNKGTNAARNTAIRAACGDFCILLDSDDVFVDDAIKSIDDVVSKGLYKEYMFAADDMVPLYEMNALLGKKEQAEVTYEDFLRGDVSGDFIHVISSSIAKKFQFPENIRIHEIITFLQFYKESQIVLFVNKIVTIRERNRSDSVTRSVIRTNKQVIERNLNAISMQLDLYKDDYLQFGMDDIVRKLISNKVENSLLLSQYHQVKKDLFGNDMPQNNKTIALKAIYFLRIGFFCRILLNAFLVIKYNFIKRKLK